MPNREEFVIKHKHGGYLQEGTLRRSDSYKKARKFDSKRAAEIVCKALNKRWQTLADANPMLSKRLPFSVVTVIITEDMYASDALGRKKKRRAVDEQQTSRRADEVCSEGGSVCHQAER